MRDHEPENPPSKYNKVGVVGFNANGFNNIDIKSEDYDYPFARLLEHLWPGDWRVQLRKMNDAIKEANKSLPTRKHAKECSEDEWWTIWGIIIFAAKAGKGGISFVYNKTQKILDQLPNIDLSDIMKQYRAQQLMKNIPFAFYGEDVTDPWNPVSALVNGFNNNRAQKVAASHIKIMDEVMSAWSPTTTKYGGLPFLSFILRKPQPLGTEFKNVACTDTGEFDFVITDFTFLNSSDVSSRHALFHSGIFLHLEIQKGALPMQAKKYSKELGGTAGCSMRIIEASEYSGRLEEQRKDAMQIGKREVFFGDSWFTSRRLCVALKRKFGHEYFGALKTNHSGTPKAEVEEIMKDWPSGSYLVLECKEVGLFYVGYKYSYKRKGTSTICTIYTAYHMHSLKFPVQFVHSLEP